MNVNNRADAHAVAAAAQADARALQAADREARTAWSPMRRDTARYEVRRLRKRIRAAADALIAFNSQPQEEPTMSTTYRACYWTDGHVSQVRLTGPEHAHLPDDELEGVARSEAERVGLDLSFGRLIVGDWTD